MLHIARLIHEAFFLKKYIPGTHERNIVFQQLHHDDKRQLYATLRYTLPFWMSLQQNLPQLARKKHLELAHCCSFVALERVLSGSAPLYHVSAQLKSDLQKLKVGWSLSLYLPWIKKFEDISSLLASIEEKYPLSLLKKQHPLFDLKNMFGHPPLGIRLHDVSALQEIDALSIIEKLDERSLLLKKNSPEAKDLFNAGKLSYQNASAQLFSEIFSNLYTKYADKHVAILDACAAPGGKSHLILEQISHGDLLLCCDLPEKLDALEDNLGRDRSLNAKNVTVQGHDWLHGPIPAQVFDIILLDSPCSGAGVSRKHPDCLWRLDEKQLLDHQKTQQQIALTIISNNLAKNGYLVYATCSVLEEENDMVVDYLLGTGTVEKVDISLSQGIKTKHGWQILPNHAYDGLFYSILQKKD